MKTIISIIFLLTFTNSIISQNENTQTKSIKPLRLGVKIGVPNIITVNVEYVTPLLNNRAAITIDYMSLSKNIDDTDINYNNFEIGTNIYLNSKGKGLYAGISYFKFDGEGTFVDVEFDDGMFDDGNGTIEFNTINLKLGVKFGRTIYFRFEVGYGFGDIPEEILVTNSSGDTVLEEIPDIPGISTSGIPVFNFGIGFSLF